MITIRELHTSDLTAACLRAVQLRHEGKVVGEMPTAMYAGNVFGEAVANLHRVGNWSPSPAEIRKMVEAAVAFVDATAEKENRPLTDAVKAGFSDTIADTCDLVRLYAQRFGSLFSASKLIGVEVPIRWTFAVDDDPVEFASHLDLLYRDPNGILTVWDWKRREDAPTLAYLARNMQLNTYALAVRYGEVLIGSGGEQEWTAMDEWPAVAWLHANNLWPYTRATTAREDGVEVQYKKGDHRPLNRVLYVNDFDPETESVVMDELATRVRMMRAGHFPTNPDPVGCHICGSKRWCPSTIKGA